MNLETSLHTAPRRPSTRYRPTLFSMLQWAASEFSQRPLIAGPHRELSYAAALEHAEAASAQLARAGVGKGTRVAVLVPDPLAWVSAFFAVTRLGALAIPLSTFYTPTELAKALRATSVDTIVIGPTAQATTAAQLVLAALPSLADHDGGAIFLPEAPFLRRIVALNGVESPWSAGDLPTITDRQLAGLLAAIDDDVTPADEAVCILTSGSTGAQKAVVYTHGTIVRHSASLADLRGMGTAERVIFSAMPLFWVGGLVSTLLGGLATGCTVVMQERFDAAGALDLIERYRPDASRAWPNAVERLREHPSYPERSLADIGWITNPLGSPHFHNSLGMTETCGPHSAAAGAERWRTLLPHEAGSFGPVVPDVERRIVDPTTRLPVPPDTIGEVQIRGYSVMSKMLNVEREDSFSADGWLDTGDLGRIVGDLIFFHGRSDDMIKTGGSNVSAAEVQAAIRTVAGVTASIVVGVPDAQRGQAVAAMVVHDPAISVDAEQVRAATRALLSNYKVPQYVLVVEPSGMPVLVNGKVDRMAIVRQLEALAT